MQGNSYSITAWQMSSEIQRSFALDGTIVAVKVNHVSIYGDWAYLTGI